MKLYSVYSAEGGFILLAPMPVISEAFKLHPDGVARIERESTVTRPTEMHNNRGLRLGKYKCIRIFLYEGPRP